MPSLLMQPAAICSVVIGREPNELDNGRVGRAPRVPAEEPREPLSEDDRGKDCCC